MPNTHRVNEESGCWDWQGRKNLNGYGMIYLMAHRVYYEEAKGPIPLGLVIDHLCRNKTCVNPDHLEAVTASENSLRLNHTRFGTRRGLGKEKKHQRRLHSQHIHRAGWQDAT